MTGADLTALAKKHPLSVACGLIAVACGALLYFRADVIADSQKLYEAKSAESATMISNVTGAPGLAEQVTEIQALAKDVDGRLVRAGQLAVNLQYFYKLEADNAVKLLDVRQGNLPRGAKGLYTPVPFTLTAQGNYPQLMKFLGELQNGRHFCRINSATFTKSGGSSSEGSGGAATQDMNLSISLDLLGLP